MSHPETPDSPIAIRSVLVIEDHPLYCDALALAVRQIFPEPVVRAAHSVSDGMRLVGGNFAPDLVILDLRLPDATGLSGFFKIKDRMPDVPVLIISGDSSADLVHSVMGAGAAGFVPKDAPHAALKAALLQVAEGGRYVPPGYKPTSHAPAAAAETAQDVARKVAGLTPQQSRIMRLICDGKPNKQIAYELNLAEPTVKAHITAILRRLGVSNRTQAAVLVNGAGDTA